MHSYKNDVNAQEEDDTNSGKKKKRAIVKSELKPILNTVHKVGFRGFIIDMESLMLMFDELAAWA